MQFTDLTFLLVFLPVALFLFYISSVKVKPYVLLCMSLAFYALGEPDYILALIVFTVANTMLSMILGWNATLSRTARRVLLLIGVAINIVVLAVYKYDENLLLPLGLSFYAFKAVSLIVDSYKGTVKIELPIDAINYLTFFGQIQSGPITRFNKDSVVGIHNEQTMALFSGGVQRFLIGFSKKVLLANVLVKVTDEVFACDNPTMLYAWVGAICFSLQLYYDFSGYSDMAIGISNMFGISCAENFIYPYATESIGGFWRRWHISLSHWFRDYVYIPLGGSRVNLPRVILNLGVVWILTGIWHGNTGGYIAWGIGYFGLITFERMTGCPSKFKSRIAKGIYRVFSLVMINFLWVVFYFGRLDPALNFIKRMILPIETNITIDRARFLLNDYKVFLVAAIIFATPIIPTIMKLSSKNRGAEIAVNAIYAIVVLGLFILSLAMIVSGESNPFLYMGF